MIKKRTIFVKAYYGIFVISLILSTVSFLRVREVFAGTYPGIKIEIDKDIFMVGEPVTGKVVLSSSIPSTFQVILTSKVYKNGHLFRRFLVNVPVFLGDTDYNLDVFGLKDFKAGAEESGRWRIIIQGGGGLPEGASADFQIVSEEEKSIDLPSKKFENR